MTNIKSRTDHFSLIIHGQQGEGEAKEAFLGKEGAEVCGTHRCVPGLTLGFLLPHMVPQYAPSSGKSLTLGFRCGTSCGSILGNLKVLPLDFCCHNCCRKGKESECGSNWGSKNLRIRLFQDAAASCATMKSESKTQNPSVRLKNCLMAPPCYKSSSNSLVAKMIVLVKIPTISL